MCVCVCVYARVCFFVRMTKTHHLGAVEGRGGEGWRGKNLVAALSCSCRIQTARKKKEKKGNTAVFVHNV